MKTTRNWRRRQLELDALLLSLFTFLLLPTVIGAAPSRLKTQNVFLIVSDGFRWQEVFNGAEEALMAKTNGGVKDVKALRAEFWRETPESRRKAILPFFWSEIAEHGQLYGNQNKGSVARVTNGKKFSYPGYNELFAGFADPRIDSNHKIPNPNVTVFEWLQGRPGLRRRVAAFGSWDAFPYILNRERSRLPVWPAWEAKFEDKIFAPPKLLLDLMRDTTALWPDLIFDSFLFQAALDHVKKQKPRVVFLGFGETDEWAHDKRYDLYLQTAKNVDRFVKTLWDTLQAVPQYRDKTTFIITADHGRGTGEAWTDHGGKVEGAEGIWIAVLGPDTPALGERTRTETITQGQIAATIAALLGEDYRAAFPQAAPAIADVLGSSQK